MRACVPHRELDVSYQVRVGVGRLTGFARAREEHGLEPGREVVHDRKVARRDEEVAHADQHRDLLPEQEGREHRLRRQCELDEHEEKREDAAEREWDEDGGGGPLREVRRGRVGGARWDVQGALR